MAQIFVQINAMFDLCLFTPFRWSQDINSNRMQFSWSPGRAGQQLGVFSLQSVPWPTCGVTERTFLHSTEENKLCVQCPVFVVQYVLWPFIDLWVEHFSQSDGQASGGGTAWVQDAKKIGEEGESWGKAQSLSRIFPITFKWRQHTQSTDEWPAFVWRLFFVCLEQSRTILPLWSAALAHLMNLIQYKRIQEIGLLSAFCSVFQCV